MVNRIFIIGVIIFSICIIQPIGINFIIQSYDLGHDGNGYEVRAQAQQYDDGSYIIVIDPDYVGSPDEAVIICHEVYHCIDWNGSEADADDYANSVGVGYIQDAYHGIH